MRKLLSAIILLCLVLKCKSQDYHFTVAKAGTGKTNVILLPGFASSGEVWNETVQALKSSCTCYVLTMPGFAGVTAEDEPDLRIWETRIAEFITLKKIDHPVIIGHSLGGVLAMWLAADYPSLLSKVIIVDALPCLRALYNPTTKVTSQPDCSSFINSFVSMEDDQFYKIQRSSVATLVGDTSKYETISKWSMLSDRKTLGKIYCQFTNTDLRDTIANIACPTLVLLESGFKALSSSITAQYKKLKSADLRYSDNSMHFIMYDDWTWFIRQVKEFIG